MYINKLKDFNVFYYKLLFLQAPLMPFQYPQTILVGSNGVCIKIRIQYHLSLI